MTASIDMSTPVTRGELQYAAIWKVAQRLTRKPVKFGTIGPELVAFAVEDRHYKTIRDRILAIADALNAELHDLADAGCPVIQFEEPQIHMLAARNLVNVVLVPAAGLNVYDILRRDTLVMTKAAIKAIEERLS